MQETEKQTESQAENPAESAAQAQATQDSSAQQATAEAASESPVEPVAAAGNLAEQLLAAQAKIAEMQDAFLRAKAEAENIRRRAQDDISRAHKFAIEGFAESLLAVKDSLEMALKIETPSVESLKEGVDMTLKQLSSAFEKNKLLEIHPQAGEKLDPMKHQAISAVPAEQEANTVVVVLQKGYTISDRLLRPALVTVAQGK
ncbi:molecular chaperone GrpE [Herbaspirillum sp. Sphag1AN]|uniref:nucleotide exchange factor GrpE n=1 Tax=unclassified Herbaspirillum TaxID=2624150 RepID=UPI001613E482|nr:MULTISPECIES: nucleotide exchange factor GrpE [unclassified Herbaspirillum]MBB3212864.1 molecular chaperone GrpE [Herbaspirillum sp. Sphag1AN]MBB3246061.1 molecular chaperone GrpE [Herbaspirillum sp. Sphag64]